MKLTKEEIKFIDIYLIKNEVKFWDVRLELLDHIVSAVEDKIQNEGISFNEALLEVHQGFGNRIRNSYARDINFEKALFVDDKGFKKFVFMKQKQVGRKHRKRYRKTFLPFLSSIKFIAEYVSLGIIIYMVFNYNPKAAFLAAMIACVIPELSKVCFGAFEKANRKSLNIQMAVAGGSLYLSLNYFIIAGFNEFYEDVANKPYHYAILLFFFLYPFLRHSFNCYREVLKENRKYYKMLVS